MKTNTATRTYKRGDRAILTAWRPEDCVRVRIVSAEYLTLTDGTRERWLHVQTDTGRLLVHPSHLIEEID